LQFVVNLSYFRKLMQPKTTISVKLISLHHKWRSYNQFFRKSIVWKKVCLISNQSTTYCMRFISEHVDVNYFVVVISWQLNTNKSKPILSLHIIFQRVVYKPTVAFCIAHIKFINFLGLHPTPPPLLTIES